MRKCKVTGRWITEGYIVETFDDRNGYYSEEGLQATFTPEEYLELYENDIAYWTQWEEDDIDIEELMEEDGK